MTQHERFLERLAGSSEAVFAVARWLHVSGRSVEIPTTQFAPTAADADSFVDGGDLFIVEKKRVEVKRIGKSFASAADWPFREVFVSNKAAVERSADQVSAWITVSADLAAVAIVPSSSRPHWFIREALAKNTGNREAFYCCPIDRVEFRALKSGT